MNSRQKGQLERSLRLTDVEKQQILQQRAQKKQAEAERTFQFKAIQVTARWSRWAKKRGEGLTFSTFVNNFCYEQSDCQAMYRAVEHILNAAREV